MLACRLKHTAGTWVDPMQPRAGDTLHRLIRLWIISYRWVIGPCLHLLTSDGTAVEERGHDARNTAFPDNVCETGERLKSCTMIVTEPNDFAAEIHDRIPAFLMEDQFAPWLSGEAGVEYLKPAPNDYLQRWPVSKRVNSSKADADDATLIEPVDLLIA